MMELGLKPEPLRSALRVAGAGDQEGLSHCRCSLAGARSGTAIG